MKKLSCVFCVCVLLLLSCTKEKSSSDNLVHSFADLKTKSIAILTGSSDEANADAEFPESKRVLLNDLGLSVLAVVQHKADFCITVSSKATIKEQLQANPSLVALPEKFGFRDSAFGFAKNQRSSQIRKDFDAFLAKIQNDGREKQLQDKWLDGDSSKWIMPEYHYTGEKGKVKTIIDITFPPYGFLYENKTLGYCNEMLFLFCQECGYTPELTQIAFSAAMAGISTGKYDVYATPLVPYPERKETIDFSSIILQFSSCVMLRRESVAPEYLAKIEKWAGGDADNSTVIENKLTVLSTTQDKNWKIDSAKDLDGKPTAAILNFVVPEHIKEVFPHSEISVASTMEQGALSLRKNKIDFLVGDAPTALHIANANPELCVLPELIYKKAHVFATPKTQKGKALALEINEYLAKIKANGDYDKLYNKWFNSDPSVWSQKKEYKFSGEKGKLIIGSEIDFAPYGFVYNGEHMGMEVDFLNSFCAEYGYIPEIQTADFFALLTGLSTGKYDWMTAIFEPTEERKESFTLTDTFVTLNFYVNVRRENVSDKMLAKVNSFMEANKVYLIGNADSVISDNASDNKVTEKNEDKSLVANFWDSFCLSFEKNFIREDRWIMLLGGLWVTIKLAIYSAIFGTLLGALICLLRRQKNPFIYKFAICYVKLFQGTPIVVLLLVLYYVVFGKSDISAFVVCVFGFSMDFSAYVSEIFRTGIDSVPQGQVRAAYALGYGKLKAFQVVVLPQAIKQSLPVYRGQLVAMVKMTSIAGYISVEDLTKVSDIIRSRTYEAFFPLLSTALIYFLIASLLTSLLKAIKLEPLPLEKRRALKIKK